MASCLPPVTIFKNFLKKNSFFVKTTLLVLLVVLVSATRRRAVYIDFKKEVLCWVLSKTINR